jgi:VCBS repeat-containing protein
MIGSDGDAGDFDASRVLIHALHPPVARDDDATTDEDTAVNVPVLANDTDADNDTLTVSAWTQGQHGSVSLNNDGTLKYTPDANYNGSDSFSYTISDGQGGIASATVAITVTPVNDAPVANAGADKSSNETESVDFDGAGSSDPDGDAVTYSWDFGDGDTATGPTPSHAYADDGEYTVTLTVSDGAGGTHSDTLKVRVHNLAPNADDDAAATNEDQPVAVNVLDNDSDPAGTHDPLQIVAVSNGTKGTASIDTKGTADPTDDVITYAPNPGETGSDSFTYTISDGDGSTATASVTVQIRNLVDLAGRVYDDLDNDGIYEPDNDEQGIANFIVQLLDDVSGTLIAAQATAADGAYSFDVNLSAGSYRIVAGQPADFLDGRETAGNLGGVVNNTQDSDRIRAINVGNPGATADAIDYLFGRIRPSQAIGMVWNDADNDGVVDFNETAIQGVNIHLTGLDDRGNNVSRSAVTDANGAYAFANLRPSSVAGYTLHEIQPSGFADGLDMLGTVNDLPIGNASVNDTFSAIIMTHPGDLAENFNFGERLATNEGGIVHGQTATIGFWQNKNGQKLINALNGGPTSNALGNWLAATFPNMYGAGANNLAGKTNKQVAEFYKTLFARSACSAAGGGPTKMDAQVMATALAVYVTNQSLAGTTAASFGFLVTATGVGSRTFNVGTNGAAFGVANGSNVTVLDLLTAVNSRSRKGILFDLDCDSDATNCLETTYRTMANIVFTDINEMGDI